MDYPVRTPAQLGQVVKGLRQARRMTQAAVAARMGSLQGKISALEANPGKASVERLFRLLSVLELELVLRERGAPTARGARRKPQW